MLDFDIPEIALITLTGLISLTIIAGLIDTIVAMVLAVAQGVFNGKYAATFLISHGKVWLAIVGPGILGSGVGFLEVPRINAAYVAAQVGLAAYVVKVIASLIDNARDSSAPSGT